MCVLLMPLTREIGRLGWAHILPIYGQNNTIADINYKRRVFLGRDVLKSPTDGNSPGWAATKRMLTMVWSFIGGSYVPFCPPYPVTIQKGRKKGTEKWGKKSLKWWTFTKISPFFQMFPIFYWFYQKIFLINFN